MHSPIVTFYLISVGILLMGAFNAAFMARNSTPTHTMWTCATLCAVIALYQLCNAWQLSATDLPSAIAAHKWVNVFFVLPAPLFWYLIASLENRATAQRMSYWIAGATAISIAYNFATPYGFRFSALHVSGPTDLGWGEPVFLLRGERSFGSFFVRLLQLLLMGYAGAFCTRVAQQMRQRPPVHIWLPLLLGVVASILGSLADAGAVTMPYLGGFAFLVVAASLSVLFNQDMAKQTLESLRLHSALEHALQSRRDAAQSVEHVLRNDPLTGLPNRTGAILRLRDLLESQRTHQTSLAVFRLDVEQFSVIRGMRGHHTGDKLLRALALRVQSRIRTTDLLARFGSAGFLIGVSGLKNERHVAILYRKFLRAFAEPFVLDGHSFTLSCNTGVATASKDLTTADALLAAAELALLEAQNARTGELCVFQPALRERMQDTLAFEQALKDALAKQEFFLCFQPQVLALDHRVVCVEALLRWQHPTYGLVMPDRFIALAESLGLIVPIGDWVIATACAQLAHWKRLGIHGVRMAVNLSAHQLQHDKLERTVMQALHRCGLKPSDLELEITESSLMLNPQGAIKRLQALRTLGVRLAIDDFGTGYSSLAYLKVLPVHAFKLDRAFVHDIDQGGKGLEICATAIRLAHSLGLEIVAEGVETPKQAQQLAALGCHFLQGYWFGKPLSAEAATAYLRPSASSHVAIPFDDSHLSPVS